jgi:hypothetical protein
MNGMLRPGKQPGLNAQATLRVVPGGPRSRRPVSSVHSSPHGPDAGGSPWISTRSKPSVS